MPVPIAPWLRQQPSAEDVPPPVSADLTGEPDITIIKRVVFPLCEVLSRYHRFEVAGIENIPTEGRALFVAGHSLATYDLFLLAHEAFRQRKRLIRALAHKWWFDLPVLRSLATAAGMSSAGPERAAELLGSGEIVGVAPGGVREMVRSYRERFHVRWEGRRGFVKLALETQTPIILGACPAGDLIYTVYPSRVTDWAYHQLRLPLPIMRGFGLTMVPRPVKLVYHLSEPIQPPPLAGPSPTQDEVDRFYYLLLERMYLHMDQAVTTDGLDSYRLEPRANSNDE